MTQFVAGPAETRHDRADRNAEYGGGLFIGEIVEVEQHHGGTKPRVEFTERERELLAQGLVEMRLFGAALFEGAEGRPGCGQHVPVTDQVGALSPVHVDIGVSQDRQQPRSRVPPVEPVEGAECSDEGLLDEVLGVGLVSGEPSGHSQQQPDLRFDLLAEGADPRPIVRCCLALHTLLTR